MGLLREDPISGAAVLQSRCRNVSRAGNKVQRGLENPGAPPQKRGTPKTGKALEGLLLKGSRKKVGGNSQRWVLLPAVVSWDSSNKGSRRPSSSSGGPREIEQQQKQKEEHGKPGVGRRDERRSFHMQMRTGPCS